jgi:hypothetical protein
MPVEGEAVYRSCGLTLQESLVAADARTRTKLRRRFGAIQARSNRVLILKRTANNRRAPTLASAFPEAKYVVLWRDGRHVVPSLIKAEWWPDHRLWWAHDRTPRELQLDRRGSLELAARNWLEEVTALERGLQLIESTRVLTLRYEQLLGSPESTVAQVMEFAGLAPLPSYLAHIREMKLARRTEQWSTSLSGDELEFVTRLLTAPLGRLSYLTLNPARGLPGAV